MLINFAIPGDRKVIKKEVEIVNFSPCNRNTAHVECKDNTSHNEGNWNHPQIFHKIPDVQTKSGTTKHSRTGHCTHTAEGKSEKYVTWEITLHMPQIVHTERLQHYTCIP
jgi:hypothetical protein